MRVVAHAVGMTQDLLHEERGECLVQLTVYRSCQRLQRVHIAQVADDFFVVAIRFA
ncbi:hypothetical protein D3C86_2226880 [compost metagenome]